MGESINGLMFCVSGVSDAISCYVCDGTRNGDPCRDGSFDSSSSVVVVTPGCVVCATYTAEAFGSDTIV
ncbi:hypothetical protein DPMN_142665 [Dreissena polymorpha]|uniref:Uncharacterized protein n=1 Tax=Dreissena polymorpha TaxID=45954 RepID=A0A9D4GHN8_DREPO|nr:hypothetical protein DPMN_142665 [Dreissena polymorpha]